MPILEYSEQQQMFHSNHGDIKLNSNGYMKVGEGTDEQIAEFVNQMRSEFQGWTLTLGFVKKYWESFTQKQAV